MPQDNSPAIQPFRNNLLKLLTQSAPWLMLGVMIFLLWPTSSPRTPGQVMFITGFFTAMLAIFTFEILMGRISPTFTTLRQRGILLSHEKNGNVQSFDSEKFRTLLEDKLNNRMQWVMAAVFLVLPLSWYIRKENISLTILPEMLIAFIIGLYAWRMMVLGLNIWQLPKEYTVKPHFEDPDNCGGLESIGNLCLWNALITAIPSLYLSLWIAVGAGMPGESLSPYRDIAVSYSPVFQMLLVIPVFFSFIAFLLPLYSIHRVMVLRKGEVLARRDELANKIFLADHELLELAKSMTNPSDVEKRTKEIELMRTVYSRHQNIPEWPVNIKLVTKFSASQVIPVLTLFGMSKSMSDVISAFLNNFPPGQ